MSLETEKAPFFFRNILIISIHLFKGLQYFAGKGLVHRDIKRMNESLCVPLTFPYCMYRFKYLAGANM